MSSARSSYLAEIGIRLQSIFFTHILALKKTMIQFKSKMTEQISGMGGEESWKNEQNTAVFLGPAGPEGTDAVSDSS